MPTIGEEYKGCRYWGYEPACTENMHSAKLDYSARHELREQRKAEVATIKAAGFKLNMGMNKATAVASATKIEETTGVKLRVFNHDYL